MISEKNKYNILIFKTCLRCLAGYHWCRLLCDMTTVAPCDLLRMPYDSGPLGSFTMSDWPLLEQESL